MKRKLRVKKFQINKKSFIMITVLCLGIGFAYLTSNLIITGNTTVTGNKWNVYFTNVQVSEGSVEATIAPVTSGTDTTSIDYEVSLDKPGDFYEFTVDAVNDGTINAMIEEIFMTDLDEDISKYVIYSATDLDGLPLEEKDVIEAKEKTTYKIRVEFNRNIETEDLNKEEISVTLSFGVKYIQAEDIEPVESEFIKLIKNNAQSDSGINFKQISSDNNGNGLYVRKGTENDTYPIYYYRGEVSNNNALFAGYCWKVVRTTETGGTKLIYNGTPDGNGYCSNTTGMDTQIGVSLFSDKTVKSPAISGYMHGDLYEETSRSISDITFGADITYENGIYTLSNNLQTLNSISNTTSLSQYKYLLNYNHYTCFNTTGECNEVYYLYYSLGSTGYFIKLADGKNIEDAFNDMEKNNTNSIIKTTIDTWFESNIKQWFLNSKLSYKKYLEDTIWCNDRSWNGNLNNYPSGFIPTGGQVDNFSRYKFYQRLEKGLPSLTCDRKNDSFTVKNKKYGNGALTYPVGLLTGDEVNLAGGQTSNNQTYYLRNGQLWWTMTPYFYRNGSSLSIVLSNGNLGYGSPTSDNEMGIRPVLSVAPAVKVRDGGDGTAETPYEFIVE